MNLPYQIIGGMKFFERAEVKDLLSYLRFSLNPKSDTDLLRIINVPPRGIGDKSVERILSRAAEDTTSAFEALSAVLDGDEISTAVKKKPEARAAVYRNRRRSVARAAGDCCGSAANTWSGPSRISTRRAGCAACTSAGPPTF